MGLSLRDQLLQTGLLTPKKPQHATREQQHQRREQARSAEATAALAEKKLAEQRALDAKAARDAELNRQKQDKLEQVARRAQIKQLVEQNRVPMPRDSEELYNFVDGQRIRRIPVDRALRARLIAGTLGIVRSQGRYELVPAEVAVRIGERDVHCLVSLQKPDVVPATDDPYKDHVVPDDLMW